MPRGLLSKHYGLLNISWLKGGHRHRLEMIEMLTLTHLAHVPAYAKPAAIAIPRRHALGTLVKKVAMIIGLVTAVVAIFAVRAWVFVPWPA